MQTKRQQQERDYLEAATQRYLAKGKDVTVISRSLRVTDPKNAFTIDENEPRLVTLSPVQQYIRFGGKLPKILF